MQADYLLDYDVVSAAHENHIYLLARVQAGPPPASKQRRPLNVGVVLDRSGSMAGDKLEYVKKATQFLVQHLGAQDRLSVTIYDDVIDVLIRPEAPIHKDAINRTISGVTARSSTNLSGGWLQGCQLVEQVREDGQVNRVILLTDGLANQGITETPRLKSMARQKREEGITTTCMGVGMDFNEDLLTQMAAEGGGAFYFIDNPDKAPQIFSEELTDLLSVVGQNLVITLTLSSNVQMVRQLNNYPVDAQASPNVAFRLGDIFADEIKSLAIELGIPAMESLGTVEVARLRFEYDELTEEMVTHRVLELPININTVQDADSREPNPEAVKPLLLLRAARAREEAVKEADKYNFERAKEILTGIADEMQQVGLTDRDLEVEHNMLREEAVDMELGPQRYDAQTRKTSQSKSFYGNRQSVGQTMRGMSSHMFMKMSREAVEREADPPNVILWQGNQLELTGDIVRIGRVEDNDIVVDEVDVSAQHCQIVKDGDEWYLEDLSSLNGTFANGGRVQSRFRLSVGDVMTVGTVLFQFR